MFLFWLLWQRLWQCSLNFIFLDCVCAWKDSQAEFERQIFINALKMVRLHSTKNGIYSLLQKLFCFAMKSSSLTSLRNFKIAVIKMVFYIWKLTQNGLRVHFKNHKWDLHVIGSPAKVTALNQFCIPEIFQSGLLLPHLM